MTKIPTTLLSSCLLLASFSVAQQAEAKPAGYRFEMLNDTLETPVPNQQRAGTCWSYASGGMLEAEMLRMGKPPVDLSEMFVVRMSYEEKAKR